MKVFIILCLASAALSAPQVFLNSPLGYSGLHGLAHPLSYGSPLVYLNQPAKIVEAVEEKKEEEEVVIEAKEAEEEKKEEHKEEEKEEKVEEPLLKKIETVSPFAYPYTASMYNGVYGYPYNTPLTYALPATTHVIKQIVTPKYVAKNGDLEHIVYKREADAQFYSGLYPNMYSGIYPNMYTNMMYNYPRLAAPVVYKTETEVVDPLKDETAKTYANDFNPFTQYYAGKGQYVADSVGARHVAKREADPQLIYPGMYASGMYSGLYNSGMYSGLYNSGMYRGVYGLPSMYTTPYMRYY